MSNLRIKNKRLKRELELLKGMTVHPKLVYDHREVVKLRSSLMLTEEDMEHLPECIEQVKWMLCEEVKNYIKVEQVKPDLNNSRFPFPTLVAELYVARRKD